MQHLMCNFNFVVVLFFPSFLLDAMNDKLDISVYDWDRIGSNDLIGVCEIPVAMFSGNGVIDRWFPLSKRFSNKAEGDKLGEVHLNITFFDENGQVPGQAQQQQPQQQQPVQMAQPPQAAAFNPQMAFQQAAMAQMAFNPAMMSPGPVLMQPQQPQMMMPGMPMMQPQQQYPMQPGMPMMQPGMPMMQPQMQGYPAQQPPQYPGAYPPAGM